MQLLSWADPWFQRTAPVLTAACLAMLVLWGVLVWHDRQLPASRSAATVTTSTTPLALRPAPKKPAAIPLRIAPKASRIGAVTLGATRRQAAARLHEQLVTIQEPTSGSGRFEVVAPKAGLRLSGTRGRIDTIKVTSVGAGPRYRTNRGIHLGSSITAVRRAYVQSRGMCANEWWLDGAGYTLKFTGVKRVSMITLTRTRQPGIVTCVA